MSAYIEEWVGKEVDVRLRTNVPVPLKGKLLNVHSLGVLLELSEGQTWIPMTSVLTISPLD